MSLLFSRSCSLWRAGLASVLLTGWLVACGGSDTVVQDENADLPSVDGARSALNASLRAFNRACIVPERVRRSGFPVTVIAPSRRERTTRYRELNALAAANVLAIDTTTDRSMERLTFRVSEQWQSARTALADSRRGSQEALCYATPEVTRIDTIKALDGRINRKLAEVVYRYRYSEPASWARNREVQREFPVVRGFLQDERSERRASQTLVQTDDGWIDARLRGLQVSSR